MKRKKITMLSIILAFAISYDCGPAFAQGTREGDIVKIGADAGKPAVGESPETGAGGTASVQIGGPAQSSEVQAAPAPAAPVQQAPEEPEISSAKYEGMKIELKLKRTPNALLYFIYRSSEEKAPEIKTTEELKQLPTSDDLSYLDVVDVEEGRVYYYYAIAASKDKSDRTRYVWSRPSKPFKVEAREAKPAADTKPAPAEQKPPVVEAKPPAEQKPPVTEVKPVEVKPVEVKPAEDLRPAESDVPPEAPAGLSVKSSGAGEILIAWNESRTGCDRYIVLRGVRGSSLANAGDVNAFIRGCIDSGFNSDDASVKMNSDAFKVETPARNDGKTAFQLSIEASSAVSNPKSVLGRFVRELANNAQLSEVRVTSALRITKKTYIATLRFFVSQPDEASAASAPAVMSEVLEIKKTEAVIRGLKPGKTYDFAVVAVGRSGARSARSAAVSVTVKGE